MIKKRRLVRIQVQQSQLQEVLDGLQSEIELIKQRLALDAAPVKTALDLQASKEPQRKKEVISLKQIETEQEQDKLKSKKWERRSIGSFRQSFKEVQLESDAVARLKQEFNKLLAQNQVLRQKMGEWRVLLQSVSLKVQNSSEEQRRIEQESVANKSKINILTLKVQDCYNRIISVQQQSRNQRRARPQPSPQVKKQIQTQQSKKQGVQMSASVLQNLMKRNESSILQEKKRMQSQLAQNRSITAQVIQKMNKFEVQLRVKSHQMANIQGQIKNFPRLFNITELIESKVKKAEHQSHSLQNQINHLKLIIEKLNLTKLQQIQKMLHLEVMKSIYKLEGDIELKMARTEYQEKQILLQARIKKMSSDMLDKADFSQVQEYFKIMSGQIKQIISYLTQHKEASLLTKTKLRCLSCQKVVNKGQLPQLQINNSMYPNRSLTFSLMKFRENQTQEKELLQSKIKKQKISKDRAKQ